MSPTDGPTTPIPAPPAPAPGLRSPRAALAVTLAVAVFFAPALLGLGAFAYRDDGRMHGPHKRFLVERLSQGHLPEWNPYGGLGFPLLAGGVDAVQHPFNALLLALPFQAGFTAWVILSVLLGGLGMLVWARALGLSEGAATLAGLALAFSGYLVSSTDNVQYLSALAALPLVFATAHRFVDRPGPGRAAALALASALAAAAGDPQSWGIALGLLPFYATGFVEGPALRARLLRTAAAMALTAAAACPFFLPLVAWIPHSSRGDPLVWIEHVRYNLLPIRLLELGLPGLFGPEPRQGLGDLYRAVAGNPYTPMPWVASEYAGAAVLALAALGARRVPRARLLVAGAAAFAWAAMGRAAGFGQLAEHIPVLSGFRYWEKVAFFVHLLLACAAAHGLESWLRAPARSGRLAAVTGAAGALLLALHLIARGAPQLAVQAVDLPGSPAEAAMLAANLTGGLLHAGLALLALAGVAALAARGLLAGRRLALAAAGVAVLDLAAVNVRAYVLVPAARLRPPSPLADRLLAEPGQHRVVTPFPPPDFGQPPSLPFEREMEHGAALLYSGWNVDLRVGNFEPYTGMVPARAMRFQLRTGYLHQLPQVGMWGIDHAVVPLDEPDPGRCGIGLPLDVAATDPLHRAALVRLFHRPRAYLAAEVASVDRRGAMEFVLDRSSVGSPRTVVEAPVPTGLAPPRGEVRMVGDEPERVALRVRADRKALLVLNDTYAPGWTAAVDGVAAEILPANYLARGIWIDPGDHVVVFRYRTPWLGAGWAVALLLALGLAGWGAARQRAGRL